MELIVVIVILAILAAKAASAKMYAQGAGVMESGGTYKAIEVNGQQDLMEVEDFLAEIKNLSAADLIGDIRMFYGAE